MTKRRASKPGGRKFTQLKRLETRLGLQEGREISLSEGEGREGPTGGKHLRWLMKDR